MRNSYFHLLLALTLSIGNIATSNARADAPEIVVWPQQKTNQLYVAEGTTRSFYVTAYNRGTDIQGATNVEFTVPENWRIWPLDEAPPQANAPANQVLKSPLTPQTVKAEVGPQEYSLSRANGYTMLVAQLLPGAGEAILKLRWQQGATTLAER